MTAKDTLFPEDMRLRFKSFINSRTGLYFKDYDLEGMEDVIAERMKFRGLDSVLAYYRYLTSSDKMDDELRELLNRLTTSHTYFFRNEPQFKALKDKTIPELVEKKLRLAKSGARDKPLIRIWSAGCSTGEEPYTIAMILKDAIPDIENWDIQILATDVSTEALEDAHKGIYGVNSMRLVDYHHRGRYFTQSPKAGAGPKYEICDEIKRMVSFGFFNLMDEDYPRNFDILFCRNVTIYFELETIIRVMNKFAESLNDNGSLFIGYSETLQFISDKFKMVSLDDAIFYTKVAHKPSTPQSKSPVVPKVDTILEEISKAEFEAESKERPTAALGKKAPSAEFKAKIIHAMKAMHSKNYEAAISLASEAHLIDREAPEPYYITAEAYANQGEFIKAKENIGAALKRDMMFAPAHYLLGSIYVEEGNPAEAEKSYRKALYLEKEFPLAHFSLANIYRDMGKAEGALREYRNTLDVLSKSNPYDIIAYSGGFNAASLASVCVNNIERLKKAE